jgi:pSer/pThr/pTyr-binding forkhead associated (FHA) protein
LNTLYAIDGPDKGKSFGLNDGVTIIGRSSDNHICISDIGVSRRHAKILRRRGKIFVVDLNSFHGVYVDGERIEPGVKVELRKDCTLHIGNTVLALQKESAKKQPGRDYAPPPQEKPFDMRKPLLPKDSSKTSVGNLELLV